MGQQPQHDPLAVMLTVKDVARSIAFYRDTLGFRLDACWPDEKQPMWANVLMDAQSIMFGAQMDPNTVGDMCGKDVEMGKQMKTLAEEMQKNKAGVGVTLYVRVPDVDAHHAKVSKKIANTAAPRTQFYGLRDFSVQDPDGYRLQMYTPIKMTSCQSCGMPLTDAEPGQMYCAYCVDETGKLKPYEVVLEGCISGYFIPQQKMKRPDAEQAAKAHLAKMPAWAMHG